MHISVTSDENWRVFGKENTNSQEIKHILHLSVLQIKTS